MTDRSSGSGTERRGRAPSPLIYEINTWVWLAELADRFHPDGRRKPLTLAGVPDEIWDSIAAAGFDAVWLMGVWRRSARGVEIARGDRPLMDWFAETMPDLRADDIVGSPYAVREYVVDDHLGGPDALATARRALADRGVALFLDYVPNHLALDHPWVHRHPSWFVGGDRADLATDDGRFTEIGDRVVAHGRDPHFPAWTDVLQLNAFDPRVRTATAAELRRIATQCDGVRCDMAMLLMNEIFAQTWGTRAGPAPTDEFWPDIIDTVRAEHPQFVFIAEAYWDTEAALVAQGFDHCYDKTLYDILRDQPDLLGRRLRTTDHDRTPVTALRFIENHDEPRAPEAFGDRDRQAAVVTLTVPGARLIHHGQLTGRRRRLPVQLGRSHDEPVDVERALFYRALLGILRDEAFRTGSCRWCDTSESAPGVLAWTRRAERSWLIVVNTLGAEVAGHVRPELFEPSQDDPESAPAGRRMVDRLSGEWLPVADDGLVEVRLPPWGAMVLLVADRPETGWVRWPGRRVASS
ncbi:alpha-amylase [Gordonia sp. HNM0687]|uniref:Alpha-amylase n=1 Tax=Gordonia mangrovi TaxID=2665643 RepID=A0A6L7GKS0_9ACTN|nr:alpha-amylase family glycosyl hydrolase [Gordonia mangrovi]MXP20490.1 alpha-amylase [Gordonia mangrovi]UVF78916.1 alpha-amylase family glycosyl hydrolase [Gordonia mangrovi]